MSSDQTPAVETLATVSAADGATVDAVQDGSIRRYSVICSRHGRIYSFYYTPACSEIEHKRFRDDITLAAAKHAADHDDTPRIGREGGQP